MSLWGGVKKWLEAAKECDYCPRNHPDFPVIGTSKYLRQGKAMCQDCFEELQND